MKGKQAYQIINLHSENNETERQFLKVTVKTYQKYTWFIVIYLINRKLSFLSQVMVQQITVGDICNKL